MRVSGLVGVDVGVEGVVVVVLWAVYWLGWVYVGVHFSASSECVEVWDWEEAEVLHDGFGVGSGREVLDESDEFLLRSDQGLEAGAVSFVCSPYGDCADEVWVC